MQLRETYKLLPQVMCMRYIPHKADCTLEYLKDHIPSMVLVCDRSLSQVLLYTIP